MLLVFIFEGSFMPGRNRRCAVRSEGIMEAAFDGLQAALERFQREGGSIKRLPYLGVPTGDKPWFFNRRLVVVESQNGELVEKWETAVGGEPWTPHRHV